MVGLISFIRVFCYENVAIKDQDIYLAKIERRVNEYPVKIFNKPREGAKLLVLDIDYTLFDHRSPAERAIELQRPYNTVQ